MEKGYAVKEDGLLDSENVKGLIKFWERRLKSSNLSIDLVTSVFIQATIRVLRSLTDQFDESNTSFSAGVKYDYIIRLIRQDTEYAGNNPRQIYREQ